MGRQKELEEAYKECERITRLIKEGKQKKKETVKERDKMRLFDKVLDDVRENEEHQQYLRN